MRKKNLMKNMPVEKKRVTKRSLTYAQRQNAQESLKIYDHRLKLEYMQLFKEIIVCIHLSCLEKESLEKASHVIEYTKIFLEDQKNMDRYFQFMKGHHIEKESLGIDSSSLGLYEKIYECQWDERAHEHFIDSMEDNKDDSTRSLRGQKTYNQAKEVLSFDSFFKLLKKDFAAVLRREKSFPHDLKDLVYLKSQEKFFNTLFSSHFKMIFYWVKSKLVKGAINPYEVKTLYGQMKRLTEEKFYEGFVQVSILDPNLLSLFFKQDKLSSFLLSLESFRTKVLGALKGHFLSSLSFDNVIEFHEKLSAFDKVDLKVSLREHLQRGEESVRKYYFDHFSALYERQEKTPLFDILFELFSSTYMVFESFYQGKSYHIEDNQSLFNKEKLFRWLKASQKPLSEEFMLRLYKQFGGEPEFWQEFFQAGLYKQIEFTFEKEVFLEIFESFDIRTYQLFYQKAARICDKRLYDLIEANLFKSNVLRLDQLLAKYSGLSLAHNPLLVPILVNHFKEDLSLFTKQSYLEQARQLFSLFPEESLSYEAKFLKNCPTSDLDFSLDCIGHFLTWYPEVGKELQEQGKTLALRSLENLFVFSSKRADKKQIQSAHALNSFLLGEASDPVEHWVFMNHFLFSLREQRSSESLLDFVSQLQISSLKLLSRPMRSLLIKGIECLYAHEGLTSTHLTLIDLIANADKKEVLELFSRPGEYILTSLFQNGDSESSATSIDIAIKNLKEKDGVHAFKKKAKDIQPWPVSGLHFMRTLEGARSCPLIQSTSSAQGLLKRFERSLLAFEKYALTKSHRYIKHSYLIYDLEKQSQLLIHNFCEPEVIIDSLAQQIRDYPYREEGASVRAEKLAEHIFYATWMRSLLTFLDKKQDQKFLKSAHLLFNEQRVFHSNKANQYFKKAREHYEEIIKGAQQEEVCSMTQRSGLN